MFFYLAKAVWFVLQPSTFIALLIGYGAILIWTGWARWGRRFVSAGALLLLVAGLSPLGNALILPLEDRFPRADLDRPPPPAGLIILGGAENRLVGSARKAPTVNEAGERLLEGAILAHRFPEAKVAFSGGDAGILYKSNSEAEGAAAILTQLGVAGDRLILEANARDTYENAVYLKKELEAEAKSGADSRWLLITSAYHMPRSMGAFRQAGFEVEPWPVDYRTRGPADFTKPFDKVSEGLRRIDTATREWVGLLAYWLTGRINVLFPSPDLIERSQG
ncbi:YdcF family protein [Methyloceanibacter sp.]|uniref:YdcF family protein n=1 Tax=Methyloceanibacter sp. TaxID=1965321 RepID=UPI002088DA58|nr:YdcF family protein [Methyloceanibacter sp.]GFO83618.1 MAG: membrane protein [Methyloceanibacter sp.]HML92080.1 YdcF family protein [Methyloceanibacter sp.]